MIVGNPKGPPISRYTRCCGNQLYVRSSSRYCCGHRIYNPRTHTCCGGKLAHLRRSFHTCCGCNYIDTRRLVCCCRDTPFPINPLKPKDKLCCNGKLYPTNGVCCKNRYFANARSCCGPYGYTPTPERRCCNSQTGTTYNPRTQACCRGMVVYVGSKLPVNKRWLCCGKNNVPFNSDKHICCCDCVYSKLINNNRQACCRDKPFNTVTEICCRDSGEVRPKTSHNACCGHIIPYRTTIHKCCSLAGVLVPITSSCP